MQVIYLSDQNLLQAYNINGIEVTINKQDGSILKNELIKLRSISSLQKIENIFLKNSIFNVK